jgi:hypothetical protein
VHGRAHFVRCSIRPSSPALAVSYPKRVLAIALLWGADYEVVMLSVQVVILMCLSIFMKVHNSVYTGCLVLLQSL